MNHLQKITGNDIKIIMDENKISVESLAAQLGVKKSTIYAWRSKRFSTASMSDEISTKLINLISISNWETAYKFRLLEFINDRAKNVISSIFLTTETFVTPRFRRRGADIETSLFEVLTNWEIQSNRLKLILAPAGFGKTTFIRMGIKEVVKNNTRELPILIPLGIYSIWRKEPNNQNPDFEDFLKFVFKSLMIEQYYLQTLEKLIQGKSILFCDGIDEIPPDYHQDFVELIKNFLGKNKNVKKVILTSRQLSFSINSILLPFCHTYDLLPFSFTQIAELAKQNLKKNDTVSFLQAIKDIPVIRRLVSIPLTLAILLAIFKSSVALDFTEAAVIEFLMDFALGKYKGARSLGGYIERENRLRYLDSPAIIRNTLYRAFYKLRIEKGLGTHVKLEEFRSCVLEAWRETNIVPELAFKDEFEALFEFLIQLGFITQPFNVEYVTFPSELIVDWFAGAYLVQNKERLEEFTNMLTKDPLIMTSSKKRQIIYTLELLYSNFGDYLSINKIIKKLFMACEPGNSNIDKLLNSRFLLVVDCLNRGLISSYELKREIRKLFRLRFESNDYALIQREFQSRKQILDSGYEQNYQDEIDYMNPFALDTTKLRLPESELKKLSEQIIKKRFNELPNKNVKYEDIEQFKNDMMWRYNPSIEHFISNIAPKLHDLGSLHLMDELQLRRQIFAVRFIPIEEIDINLLATGLNILLNIAEEQSKRSFNSKIYKYMALDSFWYLFRQVEAVKNFFHDHRFSKINTIQLKNRYFALADEHAAFRKKYCEYHEWNIETLINDNNIQAHYLIIDYIDVSEGLKKVIPSKLNDYIEELYQFANYIKKMDGATDLETLKNKLNRMAKLCIILALNNKQKINFDNLINIFSTLAETEKELKHKLNIGPRQLYDYAIFGLWSICEIEEQDYEILPF